MWLDGVAARLSINTWWVSNLPRHFVKNKHDDAPHGTRVSPSCKISCGRASWHGYHIATLYGGDCSQRPPSTTCTGMRVKTIAHCCRCCCCCSVLERRTFPTTLLNLGRRHLQADGDKKSFTHVAAPGTVSFTCRSNTVYQAYSTTV